MAENIGSVLFVGENISHNSKVADELKLISTAPATVPAANKGKFFRLQANVEVRAISLIFTIFYEYFSLLISKQYFKTKEWGKEKKIVMLDIKVQLTDNIKRKN